MKSISRESLLEAITAVAPGLSDREVVEQSSCIVFTDGQIITFNDELTSSIPCDLGFEGAIQGRTLMEILPKLPDEELNVGLEDGRLAMSGANNKRLCSFRLEKKIMMPIGSREKAKSWQKLPKGFADAVGLVRHCATSNETAVQITCLHLTAKHMEASDNWQAMRVKIALPFEDVLIRRDALDQIIVLNPIEVGESENWIHFRNKAGATVGCRRILAKYPDISAFFSCKGGAPLRLPKLLGQAADRASVFSQDALKDNIVKVTIEPGQFTVRGRGAHGSYRERQKPKEMKDYDGQKVEFLIHPQLLSAIVTQYKKVQINGTVILTTGTAKAAGTDIEMPWTYSAVLNQEEEKQQ